MKALQLLAGVGDAAAGEWVEQGEIATHLRRRLSGDEAATVGLVCDVRGTDEARRRHLAMLPYLRVPQMREFAAREIEAA